MDETQALPTKTTYKVVVHDEPEGGYWAEVPELPGCFTQGETLDALYHNLIEVIACQLHVDMASVRVGVLEMKIAVEEHRRRAAWERIRSFVEQPSVVLEEPRSTRDELHAG